MSKQSGLANLNSPLYTGILVCLVAVLSYFTAKLGGALMLRPEMVWPLWPGCAFLVAVLLVVPRRIWPALMAAGLAGFVLYDIQTDLTLRSILLLILSDIIEVLVVALGVSYSFTGIPRLNSIKRLALYLLFASILAPISAAFVGAVALRGNYWVMWRISFFTEALALLTLTLAILGWVNTVLTWTPRSFAYKFEPVVLMTGLMIFGYFTFVTSSGASRPVLLYSLVPFLLWSALRFGTTGIASSMLVVAFFSIWGAVQRRGPFTGSEPLSNVLSLQLFLFFAAIPFMVLAVLVEGRKEAVQALRESEERFRLAAQAGKMFAYDWDATTDVIIRSAEAAQVLGIDEVGPTTGQRVLAKVHPEDRNKLIAAIAALSPEKPYLQISLRMARPDGTLMWVERNSCAHFDEQGRLVGMIGMMADVTERKRAEEEVKESEARFRLVADTAPVLIWMSGRDKLCTYFNKPWLDFTGRSIDFEVGNGWAMAVHADDLQRCLDTYTRSFDLRKEFRMEYRLRRYDGEYRWVLDVGVPRFNQDHTFAGYIGSCIDITDSKLAQQNLSQANERLYLAMEAGRIGGWEWDIKSGRTLWFGHADELMGMATGEHARSIKEFWGRVHPEDRARIRGALESAERDNTDFNEEFREVWPDGVVHWLRSQGKYFYAANGEPERMLGISFDITSQKQIENELRESELRLRLAAQAGKMYAYEWDVASDSVIRSGKVASVLGLPGEELRLTRQQLLSKVHPGDRDLFIASVAERNVESPDTQIRYRVLRPDGSVMWVEKTGHAFFDEHGKLVRMIGMVADISERKLAEDKLREYKRAVEGSEEMIAVVDREYRYLIANRKFLNMRKMTEEQVVGHLAREVLNEGVFDAVVKERLDECFQAKVVRYETKYVYAELGERDVSVSYFPVEGPSGVDRVACIMQDITERKQVEEALAGISRRLIEAQEQERKRIARELHDDIGQRLSLLIVELDQLQRNSRDLPAQIRSSAGALKQKASEIVSDLQSLSHKLHSSKLQYLGITAAVRGFCREFGEQQNVEIEVNADDLPSRLSPDIALCLFRVLQEAVHNSAKHSGVRHFGVRLWLSSDKVHLAVSDSGAGFDIKTAMKGGGLGLTSMRERVRLVSGTIAIESKPSAGTTIQVCVPFKSEQGSARAAG